MGLRFVGDCSGDSLVVFLGDRRWGACLTLIDMPTAIFTAYTSQGWVIASDGLGGDDFQKDEDVKKVFPLQRTNLAYATIGSVKLFDQQSVLDFGAVLSRAANRLLTKSYSDPHLYLQRLCVPTYNALRKFQKANPSWILKGLKCPDEKGETILIVVLTGYVDGRPVQLRYRLFHEAQKVGSDINPLFAIRSGMGMCHGSEKVWDMLHDRNDPTFSDYKTLLEPSRATLTEAIQSAKNHILVCSDRRAREIDPEKCSKIGGRTQIATIKTDEGFQWVPGFEPIGILRSIP